mmetsp:Transcript_27922/g.91372  ORF Transcript_27922/g.91372 Transcript_27922/m.91372 type:complete len:412 (-) Transcript_27922:560-1795(-)
MNESTDTRSGMNTAMYAYVTLSRRLSNHAKLACVVFRVGSGSCCRYVVVHIVVAVGDDPRVPLRIIAALFVGGDEAVGALARAFEVRVAGRAEREVGRGALEEHSVTCERQELTPDVLPRVVRALAGGDAELCCRIDGGVALAGVPQRHRQIERLLRLIDELLLEPVSGAVDVRVRHIRAFAVAELGDGVPDPKGALEMCCLGVSFGRIHTCPWDLPNRITKHLWNVGGSPEERDFHARRAVVRRPPQHRRKGAWHAGLQVRDVVPRRLLRADGALVEERLVPTLPLERAPAVRAVAGARAHVRALRPGRIEPRPFEAGAHRRHSVLERDGLLGLEEERHTVREVEPLGVIQVRVHHAGFAKQGVQMPRSRLSEACAGKDDGVVHVGERKVRVLGRLRVEAELAGEAHDVR